MFEWLTRLFYTTKTEERSTEEYRTGELGSFLFDANYAYESTGFVKACIKVISESIGMLSFRVYEKLDTGRILREDLELDYIISREPNDYLTAPVYYEALVSDVLTYGNSISTIEKDGQGNVKSLTLEDPLNIDIRVNDTTGHVSYWKHSRLMDSNNLLHVQVNPNRYGEGRSPITIARENIGLNADALNFAKAYYKNGGAIKTYLTTGNKLSESTLNRMERHFKGKFTGVENAGSVPMLEEGLELKSLVNSMADSEYIASREFEEKEIATIFRIPLSKLNMLDRSTHTNIEQQQLDFLADTLQPLIVKIEKEFTKKLFKTYETDLYIKADLRQLLRADNESRAEYYSRMFNMGVMSINEIRALEELQTKDKLDNHYLNAATSKIEDDGNLAVQVGVDEALNDNNSEDE